MIQDSALYSTNHEISRYAHLIYAVSVHTLVWSERCLYLESGFWLWSLLSSKTHVLFFIFNITLCLFLELLWYCSTSSRSVIATVTKGVSVICIYLFIFYILWRHQFFLNLEWFILLLIHRLRQFMQYETLPFYMFWYWSSEDIIDSWKFLRFVSVVWCWKADFGSDPRKKLRFWVHENRFQHAI